MTIEIFNTAARIALLAAFAISVAGAVLVRWRGGKEAWQAVLVAIAGGCLALLSIEQGISWLVAAGAPEHSDFNEYRWVLLSPWGRAGLAVGAGAGAAIVVLSWMANRQLQSPWRRAGLLALRSGAVLAALVLFLEPAVELRQVAREPNRVAVLIDDSLSMTLRDDGDGPTREERARQIIESSGHALDSWRSSHSIDFYSFSEVLAPSSEELIATQPPAGKATLLRQALEQTRARYDGADLAGIVVLSDGVATGGLADSGAGEARDFLRSLDTRVHTVWTASSGLRDISIARVLADEFAFVRTVVKVDAVVRSTGYGQRRIPVTLSSDGEPLRRKWVEVGPGDSRATVTFEFTPARVGKYVYEIATPVEDDEAVEINNKSSFVLRVIRDKIRVLQVAGRPSWDVRALRGMLKQDPNVDLISFFILRTQDDLSNASNDEMSLIPFPTQELFQRELPSFDLIVLQNFDFMPYGISIYLENIRSYVAGGGGLVMLGGALSFASGRYTGTPVGEALPVKLPSPMQSPRALLDYASFQPHLTKLGDVHPISALRYRTIDNRNAWDKLPELKGVNIVGDAVKNATVLVTHPRLKTKSGKPMPVIIAGEYEQGRTLAVTTDSLWRWGFVAAGRPGDDGRAYRKFWDNAIRWLIRDPELQYLHVNSDKVSYEPESIARLDIRIVDRDYTPLTEHEIKVIVSRGSDPNGTQPVDAFTVTSDGQGEASHNLDGLLPGVYRVTAEAIIGSRKALASDIFLVNEAGAELAQPAATSTLLEEVAAATDGRFLGALTELPANLEFEPPRIVRVDSRSDIELWSRSYLLFIAFAFLGLEWLLRQRSGIF